MNFENSWTFFVLAQGRYASPNTIEQACGRERRRKRPLCKKKMQ